MARGVARRHELAIRLTLGAGRWRIARQLCVEGLLLASSGGLLGVWLSRALMEVFLATIPPGPGRFSASILMDVPLDTRVVLFTAFSCALTGCLVSIGPARLASRIGVLGALAGSAIASPRQTGSALRYAIVVPQVCLSLVLLIVSGLLIQALSEDAVGGTLTINGTAFTVVGVTKPEFFGTTLAVRSPDVWIPLVMQPVVRYAQNASSHDGADTGKPWPPQEAIEWLSAFVGVPSGTAPSSVAAALTVQRQREADMMFSDGRSENMRETVRSERILLEPVSRGLSPFRENMSSSLLVLLAMMGVLLAIACGNVAGLLIARGSARQREIAIRVSIGAGRWQLLRQLMVESLLLGATAGAAGVLLAFWSRDAFLKLFASGAELITLDTTFDGWVFVFAIALSLTTGMACGILPAIRGSRVSVADALKAQSHTTCRGRRSLFVGNALVTFQMAFCLVALVVAALFVRSVRLLTSMEIGYDREHVLTARLDVRSLGYTEEQQQALYGRILDRMRQVPGVASASLSQNGPLVGGERVGSFGIDGYTPGPGERLRSNEEVVTEDYFGTVGLRLLQGRAFGPEDRVLRSRNAIVNETIARRFFKGGDAVGKRWNYGGPMGPDAFVIVGVVEDARYVELRTPPPNMVYHLAAARRDQVLGDLEIRTVVAPATMAASVRQVLAKSEPGLPVVDAMPVRDRVARRASQDALIARLTSFFSVIALSLACLGLYSTVSYGISRRAPEIALRMALGADRGLVLRMILGEALLLVTIGATLGAPFAYVAGRSVRTMLYEVPPLDPLAYGAGAILLIAVSALAAFLPARRASRIEPMTALNRNYSGPTACRSRRRPAALAA